MASVIVDNESGEVKEGTNSLDASLVTWVMAHVEDWEQDRDNQWKDKWEEYYRLWRGIWDASDKTRDSERSKLISPALQQAVEMAVSELEEATFGKGKWFDVADDVEDQQKEDMALFRNLLEDDLNHDGVPSAMSEVFLNAALYGTGIGKMVIEEEAVYNMGQQRVSPNSSVMEGVGVPSTRVAVKLIPVSPDEFVIDTAANSIEEALGMAHIMDVPRHSVEMKQEDGIYKDVELGGYPDDLDLSAKGEVKPTRIEDKVRIIEYHGLVPAKFLGVELAEDEELVEFESEGTMEEGEEPDFDADDLVEAIVTIANDGVLLRAVENPYIMNDRCFVAFQYDTIPNRFWGRGVAEKGYNMQKAIDAELRARIDSMALTVHPMMAADATRLPRGVDLTVRPGRLLLTQGDPRTILMPFHFGQTDSSTFTQAGDLERQLQNATGSMDSATPLNINPRNSTASGMSMIQGGVIKRSKRTMANIERHFTSPLVHKAAYRRVQFDPQRYPVTDVRFNVYSTLGIMAREIEQQQLAQLLNTVPPDSPAYWMLIRGIYDNSSISNKDQMLALIDQLLQQALQPKEDPMAQLKAQELQIKQQEAQLSLEIELMRARTEAARVQVEAAKLPSDIAKKEADAALSIASAEAKEVGKQIDMYKAQVDAIKAQSTNEVTDGQTDRAGLREPAGAVQPTGMGGIQ